MNERFRVLLLAALLMTGVGNLLSSPAAALHNGCDDFTGHTTTQWLLMIFEALFLDLTGHCDDWGP